MFLKIPRVFWYSYFMRVVNKIEVRNSIKGAIVNAVDDIGGFGKFIKTGDVVLLKPNFNTADPYPASTDFEFLKSVVELVYNQEPKLVIVGDSSTMTLNTKKVMDKLKIYRLQYMEQPPRIVVFEERAWIKKDIPNAKYLKNVSISELLDKVDKLILLPCLKTHAYAQFTGSLKLSVGFMKPSQRTFLHMRHLQEKIAELNTLINPDLIIMDARKCFINGGPSRGELKEPNLIMASTDRVAIDIEGVKIIQSYPGNSLKGIKAEELPQIKLARKILG